jgi:hypothetical protein
MRKGEISYFVGFIVVLAIFIVVLLILNTNFIPGMNQLADNLKFGL